LNLHTPPPTLLQFQTPLTTTKLHIANNTSTQTQQKMKLSLRTPNNKTTIMLVLHILFLTKYQNITFLSNYYHHFIKEQTYTSKNCPKQYPIHSHQCKNIFNKLQNNLCEDKYFNA